jgi:multicomponent Na+:H+ antiporter subunit D
MSGWSSPQTMLQLALLAPLAAAALIPLFDKTPNLREAVTLIAAVLLAVFVWSLLPGVLAGGTPEWTFARALPGIEIAFRVEPLGMLFALVAGSLWLVNSVYSIGYMRANGEPRQTSYYAFFALAIAATIGIAFAKNLLTLFIFYEALTLTTFPLVTHKRSEEAVTGGRVYLGLLIGTSMVLLLPAIVWTGYLAGTLDFAAGGILAGKAGPAMLAVLLALFVFGIGKAALMPFHFWLPAAMVAPTPVSALLHAVAVVKAGVFAVLKVIVYVFGIGTLADSGAGEWLVWAAGFTVIAASLVALRQSNLKKRLAYSTVSQLSYVVLAAAILTPVSAVGAAMHIAAHAVSKITLFFAAGSIYTAGHKTEIGELDGIGRRMPWTMGAFAVGALAMIGVPPTAGFLGKWFMLQSGVASANWLAVGVIVASTVLNASYFLPIVWRAFLAKPAGGDDGHQHGEAPFAVVAPLVFTAAVTVILFFRPDVPFALAQLMIGG